MAYGPDTKAFSRRAGTFIDKILKGASAGEIPMEQPTKFEHVIKSEDRESPRPHDPAGRARAVGRGDSVTPPTWLAQGRHPC